MAQMGTVHSKTRIDTILTENEFYWGVLFLRSKSTCPLVVHASLFSLALAYKSNAKENPEEMHKLLNWNFSSPRLDFVLQQAFGYL